MQNYGLAERLPWPQDEVADSNSSQAIGDMPLSSLDVSVIGYRGDIEEIEYNHEEATVGEMIGDLVTIDTGHSDVNEPTQAKRCYIVEGLANNMVDPALGIDATVVSTMDVGFGPSNMDKDINCDKGHTQPSSDGCNFEAGVLGERHLANMVRWNTAPPRKVLRERDRWVW